MTRLVLISIVHMGAAVAKTILGPPNNVTLKKLPPLIYVSIPIV